MIRRSTIKRIQQEAARQADLRAQSALENSRPGRDAAAGWTAGFTDAATGEPTRFGLLDVTTFGEGFRLA
jgi:hypothetical protein